MEASLRNETQAEFGGFMWRYVGRFTGLSKERFYFVWNLLYIVAALLGLLRYVHHTK